MLLPRIQRREIGMGHVDLPTHFHHVGRAVQLLGDGGDHSSIRRYILARGTIAPCGRINERAIFIAQRERQPVDLGLSGVVQFILVAETKIFPDTRVEFLHVCIVKCIAQREHTNLMHDLAESFRQRTADLLRRAVGALQLWKARLNSSVAPFQAIIISVGQFWRILGVIGSVGL